MFVVITFMCFNIHLHKELALKFCNISNEPNIYKCIIAFSCFIYGRPLSNSKIFASTILMVKNNYIEIFKKKPEEMYSICVCEQN
jgi:hypothetical protein